MSSIAGRLIAALAALALPSMSPAQTDFQFKGYYKSLLATSRTVIGTAEDYTVDINRLRLELRGRPVGWLDYELQYDNEALLGSYLNTEQFALLSMSTAPSYWDLDDDYLDRSSIRMRHRVYRGLVNITAGNTKLGLGRQRIAWGSGRLWNPTDLLNPYNPTQLEFQERVGVDAALFDYSLGPLSHLSAVYAPQRDASDSRAVRFSVNVSQTDLAAMVGQFRGWDVVGAEFAGRLAAAGIHGEVAYTRTDDSHTFTRAVLGFDYAFPNTLTIGAELYWNGQGTAHRHEYDIASLIAGRIQNVARRYVGGLVRHEITPLWRSDNVFIWNADDSSRFIAPALLYSIREGLDLGIGMQLYGGSDTSEYGRFENIYYASVQWFF